MLALSNRANYRAIVKDLQQVPLDEVGVAGTGEEAGVSEIERIESAAFDSGGRGAEQQSGSAVWRGAEARGIEESRTGAASSPVAASYPECGGGGLMAGHSPTGKELHH